MKHIILFILCAWTYSSVIAQTHYDYMGDDAVAGGTDRALNGILIIIGLIILAIVVIFILAGIFKVYYWFNPKADPVYQQAIAQKERERKHEEYLQKQRKNATPVAIDLGLSVKWASFNLGAYKPSDIGDYFYWAENEPSIVNKPKHCKVKTIGDIAGDKKYDAATNLWSENWRLPTDKECRELLDKCKWENKILDGFEGRLVTGPNGNSIFFPFNQMNYTTGKYVAGHYWTSSPYHGSESANDLRFGENCKQPAEIWCATANRCMFSIRPVFTTISKAIAEKQKQTLAENAYSQISATRDNLFNAFNDYKYYQEQCKIRNDEKIQKYLVYGVILDKEKTITDEFGVIYSLDGKRLLDGKHCTCKEYKIKEGTEFICNDAFRADIMVRIFNRKESDIEKITLPSTLVYFHISSIPEGCSLESLSPNYSIIDELLIDIRKQSIVKCLNRYVQKVEIFEPIVEIEESAFINCRVLQEVILPDTIRIIGDSAFYNCEMLNKINLPDYVENISNCAFDHCESLHISHLPRNLSLIGNSAFGECIIGCVTIPNNIKEIGRIPFSSNTKEITSKSSRFIILDSLLIDSYNNELIQLLDSSCEHISIPDNIVKIRDYAFWHTGIIEITIPSTVKDIGCGLFCGCKNLKEVTFDCEIEQLPNSTFSYCSSLISCTLPNGIKSIGASAFSFCTSLISYNLPNGIKSIEARAFEGCKNLLEINLNKQLRIIEFKVFERCTNLQALHIPKDVEIIGNKGYCFGDCKNLQTLIYDAQDAHTTGIPNDIRDLTIGSTVKKLHKNFLTKNVYLESVIIPESVVYIERDCITDCWRLKEITIHSEEIELEEGWIRNCANLETIRVHANMYRKIQSLIPMDENHKYRNPKFREVKIKKIYNHRFLFFKW